MRFSVILSNDIIRRIGEEPGDKAKVICAFGIKSDRRKEIVKQFDDIMMKSRQKLIDFLDSSEHLETV